MQLWKGNQKTKRQSLWQRGIGFAGAHVPPFAPMPAF
jgi:hypothetical protein